MVRIDLISYKPTLMEKVDREEMFVGHDANPLHLPFNTSCENSLVKFPSFYYALLVIVDSMSSIQRLHSLQVCLIILVLESFAFRL